MNAVTIHSLMVGSTRLKMPMNSWALVNRRSAGYKARLQLWVELLEREKLLDLAVAAYEVVSLLPEFTPLLDPQQLKYALGFPQRT